ncbi:hypothetical protein D3C86_1588360 [compost metagenome]
MLHILVYKKLVKTALHHFYKHQQLFPGLRIAGQGKFFKERSPAVSFFNGFLYHTCQTTNGQPGYGAQAYIQQVGQYGSGQVFKTMHGYILL